MNPPASADAPGTPAPDVSVVIPTYGRADRLAALVQALESQSLERERFEVVIVDDASGDGTTSVLHDLAGASDLDIRVLTHNVNKGAAAARNTGWGASRASVVAFTDDDCQPQSGWLATLLAALEDPAVDLVQGTTLPDPGGWPPGPYAHWVRSEELSPWFETCNLACRRGVLEELDGFDTAFRHPYGEDTDLGWRATKRGHQVRYAPAAVVHHDVVERTWRQAMRGVKRRASAVQALQHHPELREHFPSRFVFTRSHPSVLGLWGAAALSIARPRWLSPWLSLGWFVRRLLQQRGRRTKDGPRLPPSAVIGWLLIDTWEIAHLLAASIRYRRLLL